MGVVEKVVRALHVSYKAFAANWIHSRPLAELLFELDGERCLGESDRQEIVEKSATLAQVCTFRVPPASIDHPPETLPFERAGCCRSGSITRNTLTCPRRGRESTGPACEYPLVQVPDVSGVVFQGLGQHHSKPSANLDAQFQSCSL